jgi:transposase IS166 family protein
MPTASNTRIGCCGNAPAREAQEVWPEEKLSAGQIELLELEPGVHAQEVEKESEVSSGRKRLTKREHAGRNALPEHLPRREEIIAVEGEERLCVCCGEERCRIGFEE